jgi:hypothetical protein
VRPLLRNLIRPDGDSFELVLDLYGPWRKPNGRRDPHMPDCTRCVTLLEDLIAEAVGVNDRCNDRVVVQRFQSPVRICVIWYRKCGVLSPGN